MRAAPTALRRRRGPANALRTGALVATTLWAIAAGATTSAAQGAPATAAPPAAAPTHEVVVSGRVKLAGFYDFGGLQESDGFNLPSIGTADDGNTDNRLAADLKQTRLRLDARRNGTRLGAVSGAIEADFRGGGGAGTNFRLRHAYVQVRGLTVGQTRTAFADAAADANVIDLDGAPTGLWLRVPLVKLSGTIGTDWRWTTSAELTDNDYTILPSFDPLVVTTYVRRPDVVGAIRYGRGRRHLQAAAVVREIRYRTTGTPGDADQSTAGAGVSVSGGAGLWNGSRLVFQALAGRGIAHHLSSFGGGGWDAVPDGRGSLKATTNRGGYVALEHTARRLRATALVGGARISNPIRPGLPDLFRGIVASLTTFYDIDDALWVGVELDHGRMRDFTATSANATRVQFAAQFSF